MKRLRARNIDLRAAARECIEVAATGPIGVGEHVLVAIEGDGWPHAIVANATVMATQPNGARNGVPASLWVYLEPKAVAEAAHLARHAYHATKSPWSPETPLARRRHERLPLVLGICARVLGAPYALQTQDISAGGAALVGYLPDATETFICELAVPGRPQPMALNARVVHRRTTDRGDALIGTQFLATRRQEVAEVLAGLRRIVAAL